MAGGLTAREQAFVAAYTKGAGKESAALAAGYTKKGAAKAANRLLLRPRVKAEIDKVMAKVTERTAWTVARVIDRLGENDELAMKGNPVLDDQGNVVDYRKEFAASNRALELIGKHLGMFVDKVEHDATSSFAELVRQATERREGRGK